MRRKFLTALSALLSVLVGTAAFSQTDQPTGSDASGVPQKPIALSAPKGKPKRPRGLVALSLPEKGVQALTVDDVAKYFKTHNLPMNMGSTADIRVEKVEIMTDRELAARLDGASTGIGPNEKVALATLGGVFIFTGPPGSKPSRFTSAYAVFDAKNGNLLMAGTFGTAGKREQ
jgi:hypothetical protein